MTHARFCLIAAPPCAALASLRSLLSTGGDHVTFKENMRVVVFDVDLLRAKVPN